MDLNPEAKFQQRPEIEYPDDYDPSLNGIGGWLVVVIIGQILSIMLWITSIAYNIAKITLVNDKAPLFGPIITAGIILFVFEIILSLMILVFIFTLNIRFRALFVIEVLAGLVYYIIAITYIYNSLGYSIGTPPQFIYSIVWISYLYNSKRINNTYIYPKLYPYPRNKDS